MVHAIRSGPSELRLVVRPNRSLTSGQAGLVFTAIATLVLAIGMGCYWLGLTLILPFSGFEVVVLSGGFYACLLRGQLWISAWLRTPEGACRSAAWFCERNGLNELADVAKFERITIKISGALNAQPDRVAL